MDIRRLLALASDKVERGDVLASHKQAVPLLLMFAAFGDALASDKVERGDVLV